jgi:ribonuclease P protein component
MKRKFRLRKSTDFKRVRRLGKSYAHPFVVLIKYPNQQTISRIGITAGRSVGNAVKRNRAKRRIREIICLRITQLQTGWDIIFLARQSIKDATHTELQAAIDGLLKRAGLTNNQHAIQNLDR